MYCRNCGTQLIDGSNYCPYCGNEIDKKDIVVPKEPEIVDWSGADKNPNEIRVPKVWSVFAKLSKIFGIVSISTDDTFKTNIELKLHITLKKHQRV